tara:strand:- start:218 stop:970 length:753 start_codon:yes stop_codon:yes gene_type:complete
MKVIRHPLSAVAMIALTAAMSGMVRGQASAAGGSISGTVKYDGEAPAAKKLEITKDLSVCAVHEKFAEGCIVSATGGLQNVFVQVLGAEGEFAIPKERPSLVQRGCQFIPHVQVLPAGSRVNIMNEDGIAHNLHTLSVENPSFNRLQPGVKKRMITKKNDLVIPEIIPLKCDLHGWMNAWIIVADHPYHAISDQEGSFQISAIPPGTYTVQFWHETLGTQSQEITVQAGADTELSDIAFKLEEGSEGQGG